MSSTVKTILGMVGAAAVGAAVGVAYAPDKGTKTRKKVQQKISDVSDGIQDFAGNAKDSTINTVADVIEKGKEKIGNIVSSVSAKV